MKFSVAQLNLLKSYLTDIQIEEIKAYDAKDHEPVKERCIVTRKNGSQCSNFKKNGDFCNLHKEKENIPVENQCSSVKKNGEKCSLKIKESGFCYRHLKKPESSREQVVSEEPCWEDYPLSEEFVKEED
jgi:hypothetical protein